MWSVKGESTTSCSVRCSSPSQLWIWHSSAHLPEGPWPSRCSDGTTCTQILNLPPGERWALSGKGPCAGKNPTKTFWKECLPPFSPWSKREHSEQALKESRCGTGCTSALCGLLSLFLPLPLGTAVCPVGERLCSPSTVPRTTWEPPPNTMPFLRSLSNLLCSTSSSPINNVAVRLDYSPLPSLSQLKILVVSYSVRRDI